ncbi:centrosomal protein CEP57L1 isoform X3 [Ochotona curzoniae]|uniref:centrosomal protein CEP57L1 isoform X3 n=1 Tax=Ochotona curzoniae TaxID=130825 RepID=UPI001B34DFC6|nr:centrosomal protein CEP57L1 isoform X3 [Ochotona curzoniae]
MDSELMHSIVGSYLRPPERVFVPTCPQNESHQNHFPVNKQGTSSKVLQSPNSQALVLALRTLQEKIHRLELERTQAEDNLNILSREAAQYKKALQNETNERNLAHQELIKQKKDISIQLSSAQSRCTLLEKQLEYTKRMVLNVEREKNMILEQQALLQREKEQDQMKLHAKLEKLDVLEKECLRLTATQKTAEDKIKQLEEKLKEEEHHRKLFQDKASEKAKCLKRGSPHPTYSKFEALPFETEKPATTGSSANASVHSLLHTMQQRRPQVLQKPEVAEHGGCLCRPTRKTSLCKAFASDSAKSTSMCDNLSELLMAMQDELDQMCVEHQELLRQMKDTESHSVYGDIECELEHLVKKMEIKKEQISKLRKHQNSVHKLQQKVQNSKMRTAAGTQREEYHQPNRSKNIKNSPRKCVNEASPSQKSSHSHPKPLETSASLLNLWFLARILGSWRSGAR